MHSDPENNVHAKLQHVSKIIHSYINFTVYCETATFVPYCKKQNV